MSRGRGRDRYAEAIERVRAEHSGSITPAHMTVECPQCRTKQVITDAPGMRRCVKCGYEFRSTR